jgi:hypothetical protein
MIRESMTGVERKHRWLLLAYIFAAAVAVAAVWFPSGLCRVGSAVLLVGLAHMTWQSRNALRTASRRSVLFYAPFLVGTNLIWMGLPLSVDPVSEALADCGFLIGSVVLLGALYVYNNRAPNALSDLSHLGNNPHSGRG